jgi:hypothetical protein
VTRRLAATLRWIIAFGLAFSLASPLIIEASSGRSKGASKGSSKSGGQKTVHVRPYTKKNGTHVAGYVRRAPESRGKKATGVSTPKTAIRVVTDPATGRKTFTNKPETPPASATRPSVSALPARDARGRFVRSEAAKHAFEAQSGYPKGRPGYVVDHIRPLACGGADVPSNMQWQTVAAAKAKDKTERVGCR